MQPTMQWNVSDDLVLVIEGVKAHSDEEFGRLLTAMSDCMKAHGGTIRVFVLTDGAGPNAIQRQMTIKAGWENNRSPVAVVSKSLVVRGIITAFTWFGMNIRAFSVPEFDEACRFLKLTPAEIQWARAETAKLRAALGLPSWSQAG